MRSSLNETAPAQCVGLKFFNVYGPNEYHKEGQRSVPCVKFADAHAGKAVTLIQILSPGVSQMAASSRDFIYVMDCVNVVLWLLDNPQVSGLFNVGTGHRTQLCTDLAQALFATLGKPLRKSNFLKCPKPCVTNTSILRKVEHGQTARRRIYRPLHDT